uniref:Uncharacterized protein n=1 Tax=viral metagenome TaxID=1070528 RepID=A0A6C0BZJ2_9ZZZZ
MRAMTKLDKRGGDFLSELFLVYLSVAQDDQHSHEMKRFEIPNQHFIPYADSPKLI